LVTGLLAGAPAQGATRAVSSPAAGIAWGACSDPTLAEANAQCGFVRVPLDYSRPGGAKISLAVSRVLHTSSDADYQGVMLVNPGGPGGSGLIYSILGQFVPNGAGNTYDWIGFDPRGVGDSRPSLSCIPDYFGYNRPYYIPVTRALERTWLARSKSYADACERNAAALLPHMKTTDSARDMDSIRKALGARRINDYGFSYGTYLAQVYSTLFPSRVRRMVLDSNVDPRKVWYQANLDQDVAFDRVINIWFGWVARYDDVYHLGATRAAVRRLWYAERRHLRRHPAGGLIGGSEWTDAWFNAPCVYWHAPRDAGPGQRPPGPGHPADRRDAGRRHALRGQPRAPQAVSQVQPDRRAGRHLARQLAVRERLRRRPDRRLPGRRHAAPAQAGEPCGRALRAAAAAGAERRGGLVDGLGQQPRRDQAPPAAGQPIVPVGAAPAAGVPGPRRAAG
jgi:pimeloyl-ACP methyl ester carboxylesterase